MPTRFRRAGLRLVLNIVLCTIAPLAAVSDPLTIVAIGTSNSFGWGVGQQNAFPAVLERMLRAQGVDATVIIKGIWVGRTGGMLSIVQSDLPPDTRIVVLQPGENDIRFGGARDTRSNNIAEILKELNERHITPIVVDPGFASRLYQWDGLHFNAETHREVAAYLAKRVMDAIVPPKPAVPAAGAVRH